MSVTEINILLGLLLGILTGLTGAGGGILAIPLLMYADGLTLTQASPIGLFSVFCASLTSTLLGLVQKRVRYRAALWMGTFGVLFAPFGIWLAHQLPVKPLTAVFALLLLLTGWRMWKGPGKQTKQVVCQKGGDGRLNWTARCAQVLALTGSATGTAGGLLGVGGGFVIVPALRRYTTLDMASIQATALAITAMTALSGTLTNVWHQTIDWSVAVPFTVAVVIAMLASRHFATRFRTETLVRLFALLCVGVGVLMLARLA